MTRKGRLDPYAANVLVGAVVLAETLAFVGEEKAVGIGQVHPNLRPQFELPRTLGSR